MIWNLTPTPTPTPKKLALVQSRWQRRRRSRLERRRSRQERRSRVAQRSRRRARLEQVRLRCRTSNQRFAATERLCSRRADLSRAATSETSGGGSGASDAGNQASTRLELSPRAQFLSLRHTLSLLSLSLSLSPSPSLSPSLPVACSLQMLCWLRAVAFAAALHSEPWGVAQATPHEGLPPPRRQNREGGIQI